MLLLEERQWAKPENLLARRVLSENRGGLDRKVLALSFGRVLLSSEGANGTQFHLLITLMPEYPLAPRHDVNTEFNTRYVEKKNQLDATEWFIALIICSTCFAQFYAHHLELETICVILPPMVCSAWLLVVGGQVQDSRLCVLEEGLARQCNIPLPGRLACCPSPDPRQPATKNCTS